MTTVNEVLIIMKTQYNLIYMNTDYEQLLLIHKVQTNWHIHEYSEPS